MRYELTAGMAVRGAIRRYLYEQDINFIEDKGWIESRFYLKCSQKKLLQVYNDITRWRKGITSDIKEG